MVLHDQMPKTLKGETRMKIFEAIRAEAEARWAEVKEMQQTGEGYDE